MVLVAKPAGPTSHDVVDIVRRALGVRRVGHLGTLDPFAAGLLVLVVGRATRLATFASGWTKAYDGVIRLGVTTDTDDATGRIVQTAPCSIEQDAVTRVVASFRGSYAQRPPAYSAVKIAGQRAYARARRGETVEPAPRRVEIRSLEITGFAAPDIRFAAVVSGGTYLRSLARDIGVALGCGAHLAALRRTAVGALLLADAVAAEAVTPADVRDPAMLVDGLARREVSGEEREAVVHGRPIRTDPLPDPRALVAVFSGGKLVAVAAPDGDSLKPRVVVEET